MNAELSKPASPADGLAPVYAQYPIEVVAAEGVWLHTRDGRKVLDLYGGHAVASLGYGHKGWTKALGQLKALEGDELEDMKAEFHYGRVSTLVPLLKDKDFKLAWIGEEKVDDKPVIGIKVSAKGYKDIDLYFDKASGLVVKSVRTGRDSMTMKEAKWESFYSDFKDHNGLKHATKAKILQDGVKFIDAEVTEFELLDKVDEKEFAKPGKDA